MPHTEESRTAGAEVQRQDRRAQQVCSILSSTPPPSLCFQITSLPSYIQSPLLHASSIMTTVAESSITPTHLDSTSAAIDADARASYGSASHAGSPLAFATLRPTSDMSHASSVPSPLSYSQQEHEPERDPDRSERTSPHSSYIMTGSEPPRRSSWVGEGEEDRGEQAASESAPAVHILGINYSPNGDGNWNGAIQEEDEESAEGGAGQDSFAAKSSRSPVTPKQTDFHPLRLDGQPSPPPWEVIPPPTSTAEEYHTKAKDSTSSKPYVSRYTIYHSKYSDSCTHCPLHHDELPVSAD